MSLASAVSGQTGAFPSNGAAIVHHAGFWDLHETPPTVRKHSERVISPKAFKGELHRHYFRYVGNNVRWFNTCAGVASEARPSRRPAWTTFRLAKLILRVTMEAMGMEFP